MKRSRLIKESSFTQPWLIASTIKTIIKGTLVAPRIEEFETPIGGI